MLFNKLATRILQNQSMLFHWFVVWVLIGLSLGFSFTIRGSGLPLILNDSPIGFTFGYFSSLLLLGFITYFLISSSILSKYPILAILVLAGGWSNLIEKAIFDNVVDYINVGISNLNLADVQIILGVVLLNFQFWFNNSNQENQENPEKLELN